jgi:hypothetical protein
MLVHCNLHNLPNIQISINGINQLLAFVGCEEFKMIKRPHIIVNEFVEKIQLEKSYDNIKPVDAGIKYVADVFEAFPDV